MSDLIADMLNNRIKPVPLRGTVDGIMNYPTDHLEFSDSEPEGEEEEQKDFVKKEMESYFNYEKDEVDTLNDINDGGEESLLGSDVLEQLHVPRAFNIYKFHVYDKKELPIDSFRSKILSLVKTNSVLIIHGPTGCGKTTQVPQYILDECKENKAPCNIVVTQPRRIAAMNIAQRVCAERAWALGTVCGYQVGLDRKIDEDVILTYMTTEVLLQKLILHKNLNKFTHVIIDEVHERSKSLDFLLLLVRKYLYTTSPYVRIILMSATMEAETFAYYFRTIPRSRIDCHLPAPILHVDKKSEYKTSVYYNEQFTSMDITYNIDEPSISIEQYDICAKLIAFFDGLDEKEASHLEQIKDQIGSVLVFLPGFHEIEEMDKLLKTRTANFKWPLDIIPLHSSLTSDNMLKAFNKSASGIRKVILSTNIAESSVTVPDVKYVVDFCLTKVMTMNNFTKFATLQLQWASHNNCTQRAGRVGRVSDGRVYRLVPYDFYMKQMPANSEPEIKRAPLENVVLYVKLLELNDAPKDILALAIDPPNLKDIEACIWRLKEAGALLQTFRNHVRTNDGDLTFIGRVMGALPIDIHMSKMIILGHLFSCLDETVIMAAGAMTRNVFVLNYQERFKSYRKKLLWADGSCSDFMILLNLYNVWLSRRRENAFRNHNEEYAWCRTNFVNLKGLREWDQLIKEIHARLKKFNIVKPVGAESIILTAVEKPTLLKVIIAGAFYPNYYIRSADFGQIDTKEAVKILNGRDPYNTVYFTNMKPNQPGHIYVRQMKELVGAEDDNNVKIGFDAQSTKIFVEYNAVKHPERVFVDGRQYVTTMPGNIAPGVYEGVRKRQLKVPFVLKVLPDHKAWAFAKSTEEKHKLQHPEPEEVNCFTALEYSPIPTLDVEYMTVTVSHVVDPGHFYCQHWNEETRNLLDNIYTALNAPNVFLDPVEGKLELNTKIYAAIFNEDSKFYRCVVSEVKDGRPPYAMAQFIDYGNTQSVPTNRMYHIPDSPECRTKPIAMCCSLSEIQPHLVVNPNGIWSDRVNRLFKTKTEQVLLNAKVYSVVDNIVHLEFYSKNAGGSFNQWLVSQGLAQKCEESRRSQMDHETRQKVLSSEHPSSVSTLYNQTVTTARSYADFEAPSNLEATELLSLKGPFSPLEMRVCSLTQAGSGNTVGVDHDSVNAVLLDDNPEDGHARLLVAGIVSQSASSNAIKLGQTTMMPAIPGFPMLVMLMFCPRMEPKLIQDGNRVASILCGLGSKEYSQKAYFPMDDLVFTLDTDLRDNVIIKINELRYYLNQGVETMNNIYQELSYTSELCTTRLQLKERLFEILHMKFESVIPVQERYASVWQKSVCEDVEILRVDQPDDTDDIWPLLWFVKLKEDDRNKSRIQKNLDDMLQIARRLAPEREIVCELCDSPVLKNIQDVRVHMFKNGHQNNVKKFEDEKCES